MDKLNIHEEVRWNKIKTHLIISLFIILIAALGYSLGIIYGAPIFGFIVAVIGALFYTIIMYIQGSNLILKTTGAREVTKREYPHLFHTVEGLAIAAGIPTPKCYVIDDTARNAFATGRSPKNASITVTTGLLATLDRQELEGVVAHEMSHIKNYDIRVMLMTAVLVGITILLSDFILRSFLYGGHRERKEGGGLLLILIAVAIVLAILAPIIGELIKLAVSRRREYLADSNGALLTRNPEGLASALGKIKADPDPLVDKANKATAHLFISTPFRRTTGVVARLFSTHPAIEDRINRLKSM
ncbi:M48 family metallopeptidase [Candidatus Woesearchaeota archaeon]|nr:M48 family metallopeptidase [Candidatus Woesearchaeota archaeon]